MAQLTPNASADSDESPPPSLPHHRSQSASEKQRDQARLTFNKTIEGHYRHGKTGYRQVGALFLTWKDDDLQCRTTEVDKLRELFKSEFNFKAEIYEIPSDRWETALHKKLAEFCHEYDSPEDLAILYYGGHAYTGEETKKFKFAAKFKNDGNGDPTAFFSDMRTCLRLPRCDQLIILDCCYAARAFAREHIGKGKFELLTSAPHDRESPAPHLPHSFTTTLYSSLQRLIKENPKGFDTSHLYREVYHAMPTTESPRTPNPKPLLFDQARYSFGRIWLRPQIETDRPPKAKEEGRYLNLTFRLNDNPDLAVMNELAVSLQFLPHVDQIRFEDLRAPKEQITDFMQYIIRAGKLRPFIRKIHARRQLRKFTEMSAGEQDIEASKSLIKLHMDQNHHPAYDWSSASEVSNHSPENSEHSRDKGEKAEIWPPAQTTSSTNSSLSHGQLSAEYKPDLPGPGTSVSTFVPQRVKAMPEIQQGQDNGTIQPSSVYPRRRGDYNAYDRAGTVVRANTGSVDKEDSQKHSQGQSPDRVPSIHYSALALSSLACLGGLICYFIYERLPYPYH